VIYIYLVNRPNSDWVDLISEVTYILVSSTHPPTPTCVVCVCIDVELYEGRERSDGSLTGGGGGAELDSKFDRYFVASLGPSCVTPGSQ